MVEHFEAFLATCMDQGHTQVKLVPRIDDHGKVAFYAVGQCGPASGETFEAVVSGKHVRRMVDMEPMPVMDEAAHVGYSAPVAEILTVGDLSDAEIAEIAALVETEVGG